MRTLWRAALLAIILLSVTKSITAQEFSRERTFPQSKIQIEKALKTLQSSMAGRLPTLEGFVAAGDLPLDRFRRPYYQSAVEVTTVGSSSLVRVTSKISAWYEDSVVLRAGYRVLPSNGRLENDLLDRLADAMSGSVSPAGGNSPASSSAAIPAEPEPSISAPMPRIPDATMREQPSTGEEKSGSLGAQTDAAEKREQELAAEASGLEEILQNQAHPKNLVAVKKSGTQVLQNPNVQAKVLFAATAGDEFELLDANPSWVHVRISGLSRGWIRRSSLEMPDDFAASTPNPGKPASEAAEFHSSNEQLAPFPGDWAPLRGKIVKIVTVQKNDNAAANSSSAVRLEFAKSLFMKQYAELSRTADQPAGIVLIFDSEDGGMVAATMATLKMWQEHPLPDETEWKQCFFDPPELVGDHR